VPKKQTITIEKYFKPACNETNLITIDLQCESLYLYMFRGLLVAHHQEAEMYICYSIYIATNV
jgi:hypothetical protein